MTNDIWQKRRTFTLALRAMGCYGFIFTDIFCRNTISIYLALFYINMKQLCTHFWNDEDQSFAAAVSWMLVFWCRQVLNINFQINHFITSLLRYEMQSGHTLVHEHDILTSNNIFQFAVEEDTYPKGWKCDNMWLNILLFISKLWITCTNCSI
jgi:hypothetical protein